ncbi:MAG TPA: peptide deformylase [Streptosporangiaceae bacterium]|jgi:peptide deformylase
MSDPGVLPIIECGDPVLRQPAAPVEPSELGTGELQLLIAQMRATMEAAPGVGLAATQVGVSIQLAVLYDGPERWGQLTEDERTARERNGLPFTVLVNPTLQPLDDGDKVSFYEGCLSVPGIAGVVARHRAVRVAALDENGQPVDRVFSGWAARIVQHEVDHLGGRLYLDRVETRSLSTTGNYAQLWAGRPPQEAAASLGFALR